MSEIDKPIEQSTSPVAKPENWERFGPREHEPCEHGIFDFEDCRACRARLRAAPYPLPEAAPMADQLLPCPFCGEMADFEETCVWWVRCQECFAEAESAETVSGAVANWNRRALPPSVRDFLGKVQGVCMGVAVSGRDHPNPDGALMELFNEAQAILFPTAATVSKGVSDE